MYYQNRRRGGYRHRPVPRIAFRIYALLWLIPIIFFLAAPSISGLLVTVCIAIAIWIMMTTWQKTKSVELQISQRPSYRRPSHGRFPLARLKQPSPSRYERDLQVEKFARYDDYEQPQAHYPEQEP